MITPSCNSNALCIRAAAARRGFSYSGTYDSFRHPKPVMFAGRAEPLSGALQREGTSSKQKLARILHLKKGKVALPYYTQFGFGTKTQDAFGL